MITGIILASGFSRRMGEDKLLLKLKDESIIETVIKSAHGSNLDRVIIVYRKEEIKKIADKYNLDTIINENADLGQSESIKTGVKSIEKQTDFMFIMGDQPFIDSELINRLIKQYYSCDKDILVPYYNEQRGMPSIIGRKYKDELLKLQGDKGGRDLMNKYSSDVKKLYLEDDKRGTDIDTLEDLERVKKWI